MKHKLCLVSVQYNEITNECYRSHHLVPIHSQEHNTFNHALILQNFSSAGNSYTTSTSKAMILIKAIQDFFCIEQEKFFAR